MSDSVGAPVEGHRPGVAILDQHGVHAACLDSGEVRVLGDDEIDPLARFGTFVNDLESIDDRLPAAAADLLALGVVERMAVADIPARPSVAKSIGMLMAAVRAHGGGRLSEAYDWELQSPLVRHLATDVGRYGPVDA